MHVCMCVSVCVCARARVYVSVCTCVCTRLHGWGPGGRDGWVRGGGRFAERDNIPLTPSPDLRNIPGFPIHS